MKIISRWPKTAIDQDALGAAFYFQDGGGKNKE
jgi:hypothetical protein